MKNVWTKYWLLMPVLVAQALAACIETDYPFADGQEGSVTVNLALSVQTAPRTRTATDVVQLKTDGSTGTFRGLREIHAIPYGVKGTITKDDNPLLNRVDGLPAVENTNYFYGPASNVPVQTASFLCYASAALIGGKTDKASNGSIVTTAFSTPRKATADLKFEPEPIYNSATAHESATAIANYLSTIAQTYTTPRYWYECTEITDPGAAMLFKYFTNEGQPMAASSANISHLIADLTAAVNRMDAAHADFKANVLENIDADANSVPTGFPASIGLPDGAAVVQWDNSKHKFEVRTEATTVTPITTVKRFVYPAELYYYANSQIDLSNTEKSGNDYQSKESWNDVLSLYEYHNGVVSGSTRSVAISKPLQYAVGCLKANVVATSASLIDADEQSIPLTNGSNASFPVTGLLVSGQFKQNFDFAPTATDINECVIYDQQLGDNISLSTTATAYFYTLVFQSKETDAPIKVALEFQNNSGRDFKGVNGIVYQGTKFYLVGQLKRQKSEDFDADFEKRVFTKNYITQMQLKVNSLANAYNVVPDLISARLELGVQLTPEWIAATPTNVPF